MDETSLASVRASSSSASSAAAIGPLGSGGPLRRRLRLILWSGEQVSVDLAELPNALHRLWHQGAASAATTPTPAAAAAIPPAAASSSKRTGVGLAMLKLRRSVWLKQRGVLLSDFLDSSLPELFAH